MYNSHFLSLSFVNCSHRHTFQLSRVQISLFHTFYLLLQIVCSLLFFEIKFFVVVSLFIFDYKIQVAVGHTDSCLISDFFIWYVDDKMAILAKRVPYSQQYLFNAIPDTNHNANPTNLDKSSCMLVCSHTMTKCCGLKISAPSQSQITLSL